MKCMLILLLLLLPTHSCQSVDQETNGPDAVRLAILEGAAVGGGVTLRAATCKRCGDLYEMTGVQLAHADGRRVTASTGTVSSKDDNWQIALSGARASGPGGGTEVGEIVIQCPNQLGALPN